MRLARDQLLEAQSICAYLSKVEDSLGPLFSLAAGNARVDSLQCLACFNDLVAGLRLAAVSGKVDGSRGRRTALEHAHLRPALVAALKQLGELRDGSHDAREFVRRVELARSELASRRRALDRAIEEQVG